LDPSALINITKEKLTNNLIVELEEKDEAHLKCPEDTTSISSNNVRDIHLFFFSLLCAIILI